MIIFWRGKGLSVLPIMALAVGAVVIPVTYLIDGPAPDWAFIPGAIAGGVYLWWWGRKLHKTPTTPEEEKKLRKLGYMPGQKHDFMFLKVQYWGAFFVVIGVKELIGQLF